MSSACLPLRTPCLLHSQQYMDSQKEVQGKLSQPVRSRKCFLVGQVRSVDQGEAHGLTPVNLHPLFNKWGRRGVTIIS